MPAYLHVTLLFCRLNLLKLLFARKAQTSQSKVTTVTSVRTSVSRPPYKKSRVPYKKARAPINKEVNPYQKAYNTQTPDDYDTKTECPLSPGNCRSGRFAYHDDILTTE